MSSPSDPSSLESAASTSGSNERVCELCGSVSRMSSAEPSLPSIGQGSLAIPTCAPLWPTPDGGAFNVSQSEEAYETRKAKERKKGYNGNGGGTPLGMAVRLGENWAVKAGQRCPCRCHTSTSSAEGSPAKTSPSPAKGQASTGNVRVFGESTPGSFASYDLGTSSWRTSQLCLDGDLDEFSGTWPRAGMTRSGIASRLAPLAPLTGGTASGLLPTPSAVSYGYNQGGGMGRVGPVRHSLQSMAKHNLWGTPTSRDWKDVGDMTNVPENGLLGRQVGGSLNPTWVEWLMGFPTGWDRLAALGNSLVPQIAEWLGRRIVETEEQR